MRGCIRAATIALVGAAVSGGAAAAQDKTAEEAAMEKRIRAVGIAIGNAYVCTESDARETFKEEAHHLYDLINQDVGTDLAFVYATSLGYGSAQPKDDLDCPRLLEQWEEFREDWDLKDDGR